MKYLTVLVMSMTILLFAACSNGGTEPTMIPKATESKPTIETAVPPETPVPTDKSYPASEPTPEAIDSYPALAATLEPFDPYPEQAPESTSDITPDPADGASQPDESTSLTQLISEDLAMRLGHDVTEITVVSTEATDWSDSSLGCPAPGYAYAQVITPGYQIILNADGTHYDYHTDMNGNFLLCGKDGHPVE